MSFFPVRVLQGRNMFGSCMITQQLGLLLYAVLHQVCLGTRLQQPISGQLLAALPSLTPTFQQPLLASHRIQPSLLSLNFIYLQIIAFAAVLTADRVVSNRMVFQHPMLLFSLNCWSALSSDFIPQTPVVHWRKIRVTWVCVVTKRYGCLLAVCRLSFLKDRSCMCIYIYIFKSINESICTEFVSLCAEVSHHNHSFPW